MSGALAARLPGGRLHLWHGPIDLVIGADGDREAAFDAAASRFGSILQELVDELPALRRPGAPVMGKVARRMAAAVLPFQGETFVTPMAAVAGAVAEEVLAAMCAVPLRRAYVNNGGDIALHLAPGEAFAIGIAGLDGAALGTVEITDRDALRGIATSGRGGRSLTRGIADSVTVLAPTAAMADAAATLIANAVDLPGHPAVLRAPACAVREDSDLGARPVVTGVGALTPAEIAAALDRGLAAATAMRARGLVGGAALFLRGAVRTLLPGLVTA